jgi:hypothetical protein
MHTRLDEFRRIKNHPSHLGAGICGSGIETLECFILRVMRQQDCFQVHTEVKGS